MTSERTVETRVGRLFLLSLAGIGCFLVGCLANLALVELAGAQKPSLSDPVSFLPVMLPLLDTLLLVAFLRVSFDIGWPATRTFWITLGSAILCGWLLGVLIPNLLGTKHLLLAVFLRWCGPVLVGLLCVVVIASNPRRLTEVWYLVESLLRGGGLAAFVVAIVLPLRVGLLPYSLPPGISSASSPPSRLQHVNAPAEFARLTNPFETPQLCVVLEQVGTDADAVQEVVRGAVVNRTAERAAELLSRVPITIREVADQTVAAELAEKIRDAGASCSVRDALDVFIEFVEADPDTAIGRPSQVLDDEYLRTGHDSIAELRAAMTGRSSDDGQVDRELAKRAYVAFATAQGRALYQINCRPCHGTKGSGDGPMAAGFSLRPANFRDALGLHMLKPGEVLWRIEEGGAALPPEATPWDSSMPAWRHELDRELVWKIILGEFSTSNAKPAAGGTSGHQHRQPIAGAAARQLPEQSWLDWPVPAAPPTERMRDPEFVQGGTYLYYYRCMPCHGVTGRGDGPAADTMWPRPRDFTTENFAIATPQPKFKFRTTKQGWLPIDQDLYRTISRGLTGTAMEGWNDVLSPQEIWQLISYIKTFSPAWNDPEHIARNPNDPVVVKEFTELDGSPPVISYAAMRPPRVTPQLATDGRDVFLRFRCFECHGFEARGDGPALGQHYDDWGYRMWPQNLAKPFNYKAGHAIKEIYRTFANRLDGTVMPVYSAETLDRQDPAHGAYLQWALAGYVSNEVQSVARITRPVNAVIATRLAGTLPSDPRDPQWQSIPMRIVPLSGQVIVAPRWPAPSVNEVAVRVAVNSTSMAIWLQWDDRRPNVTHQEVPTNFGVAADPALGPVTYAAPALRPKAPVVFDARDQLEIQFSTAAADPQRLIQAASRPPLLYGSEQSPVLLWRWSADRQGLTVTKQLEDVAGAKAERFECTSESSAGHDRAIDWLTAHGPSVEPELLASRPGTQSRADWSNGAWTLVVSGSPIEPEKFMRDARSLPTAIHIWDGLAGESDRRMAISSWIDIVFRAPRPAWHHVLAALLALIAAAGQVTLVRQYRMQTMQHERERAN